MAVPTATFVSSGALAGLVVRSKCKGSWEEGIRPAREPFLKKSPAHSKP